jgi:hypothetical protein
MGLIHDIVTLVTEPLFTGLNSTFGYASEDPPDVVVCVFLCRWTFLIDALLLILQSCCCVVALEAYACVHVCACECMRESL